MNLFVFAILLPATRGFVPINTKTQKLFGHAIKNGWRVHPKLTTKTTWTKQQHKKSNDKKIHACTHTHKIYTKRTKRTKRTLCTRQHTPTHTHTHTPPPHAGHLVANTEINLFMHNCTTPPCTVTQMHCPAAGASVPVGIYTTKLPNTILCHFARDHTHSYLDCSVLA